MPMLDSANPISPREDYRAAQSDFQSALRLNPEDQATAKRLDLSSRVLALDPGVRGIGAAERFRRSRELVQMALDDAACLGANPAPSSNDVARTTEPGRAGPTEASQELLDDAQKALKERVNAAGEDEATETNLDLAMQLWQARKSGCQPAPDPDDPLGLVLAKAAR